MSIWLQNHPPVYIAFTWQIFKKHNLKQQYPEMY